MALEDLTGGSKFIDDFVNTNPVGTTDTVSELDDHIRGIKNVLLNTFPNVTGAVTATHTELNLIDGVTATTAELNILDGVTSNASELNYVDLPSGTGVGAASKALVLNGSSNITSGVNSFAATTFVGALTGNADTATSATTATTATNFSGSLSGDVTGTQGATVVGNDSHNHTLSTITDSGALAALNEVSAATIGNDAVGNGEITTAFNAEANSGIIGASGGTWVIPNGHHMMTITGAGNAEIDIFNGSIWRVGTVLWGGGFVISDGTNFRVRNDGASDITVYYRALSTGT